MDRIYQASARSKRKGSRPQEDREAVREQQMGMRTFWQSRSGSVSARRRSTCRDRRHAKGSLSDKDKTLNALDTASPCLS